MNYHTTEYRTQSCKNDLSLDKTTGKKKNDKAHDLHNYFSNVTVAGKPQYLDVPKMGKTIVMPQEFKSAVLEDKIKDAWKTQTLDP